MLLKLIGKTWIFCLLLPASLFSQSLNLKVAGSDENESKILDSLNYKTQFEDYQSLYNEVIDLKKRIETIGFLESKLAKIEKNNDSTFLAHFNLGIR